jgi:hypothetical protein
MDRKSDYKASSHSFYFVNEKHTKQQNFAQWKFQSKINKYLNS